MQHSIEVQGLEAGSWFGQDDFQNRIMFAGVWLRAYMMMMVEADSMSLNLCASTSNPVV